VAERFYKFLLRGSIAPFSRHVWRIGEWVKTEGELDACTNGVHLCRQADLPYWLADELWEVDVAGDRIEHAQKVVVRRARLRARVDGWPTPLGRSFARDCAWRVRDLAVDELRRAAEPDADALAGCRSLRALGEVSAAASRKRRPDRPAIVAEFLGYAQDAADFAAKPDAVAARYVSYVAAHAADRASTGERLPPGTTRFTRERERQASVLHELGL
jgi:hypothetical protein